MDSIGEWSEATGVVRFARERLGFDPDAHQTKWLKLAAHRGILNCTRQWGKSTVAAVKAVHEAYFRPESRVVVVSPSERQSGELIRKAAGFVRRLGLKARGDGGPDKSLLLPNGSRIVGMPAEMDNIRGISAVSLLLVDEAARVPDELYLTVRPMLAVSNGDIWLMSTPRGKRGFFWEEWANGGPGWQRMSVPALECKRIPAEFLEEERQAQGDRWFRQEYLCEFVDTEEKMFQREWLERAITSEIKPLWPDSY